MLGILYTSSWRRCFFFFVLQRSKQMLKIAKRTFTDKIGMSRGRKKDGEVDDPFYELSRCNSYDFEATGGATGIHARDSDIVCVMERHLVPVEVVRTGMGRFSFLMETCAPGTIPDPLLIAALLDLVSVLRASSSSWRHSYPIHVSRWNFVESTKFRRVNEISSSQRNFIESTKSSSRWNFVKSTKFRQVNEISFCFFHLNFVESSKFRRVNEIVKSMKFRQVNEISFCFFHLNFVES